MISLPSRTLPGAEDTLFRGYGPFVALVALILAMAFLAPTVAPERDMTTHSRAAAGRECGSAAPAAGRECGSAAPAAGSECGSAAPAAASECGPAAPAAASECGPAAPAAASECGPAASAADLRSISTDGCRQ